MFRKVSKIKNPGQVTTLGKQIEFTTGSTAEEFRGIRYYDVESSMLNELYALLPKEVHQDFYASWIVINDNIPPHTDIVETAGLNCYTAPGQYSTNFYSCSENAEKTVYADHGEGHIYNPKDLLLIGSFYARPFEVYLIDNKVIHEVYIRNIDKPVREVLQLATNKYSYLEVREMIKDRQNVL